jgi:hypothetical protein
VSTETLEGQKEKAYVCGVTIKMSLIHMKIEIMTIILEGVEFTAYSGICHVENMVL